MKKILHSKYLKICLALSLALVLLIALGLPTMAKDNGKAKSTSEDTQQYTVYKGKVTTISDNSFEIQTSVDGNSVLINVNGDTKYYVINGTPKVKAELQEKLKDRLQAKQQNMQGKGFNRMNENGKNDQDEEDLEDTDEAEECLNANAEPPKGWINKIKSWFNKNPKFGKSASFGDIVEGDGIVARGTLDENENFTATQVLIVKAVQPSNVKVVRGQLSNVNTTDNTFTITDAKSGSAIDIICDEKTQVSIKGAISLVDGQYAMVTYKVDTRIAKIVHVQIETLEE